MGAETLRFREKIEASFDYYAWVDGGFKVVNSVVLLRHLAEFEEHYGRLWSARMTGIFGRHLCPSGNGRDKENFRKKLKRIPKNREEVILAFGDVGLLKLLELGFVPCPSCRPDELPGFWEAAGPVIGREYGFADPKEILDRKRVPFDARRIKWEELPVELPSRLYLPKGLTNADLQALEGRFAKKGWVLPEVGYYDANVPGRFVRYEIIR